MWKEKSIKMMAAAFMAAMLLLLAACGDNGGNIDSNSSAISDPAAANSNDSAENSGDGNSTDSNSTEAVEVFTKAAEASNTLESFSVAMKMNQKMTLPDSNEMTTDSDINIDVILNPFAFKQQMKISSNGMEQNIEMYYTNDSIVMLDTESGEWIKLPQEQVDAVLMGVNMEDYSPSKDMERLKRFSDDFILEETDKEYLVKLTASGDQFNEFVKEQIESTLGQMIPLSEIEFAIDKVEYTFTIDKETYLPIRVLVNMNFGMIAEGEKLQVEQQVDASYSNLNEVKEIEVPEEAESAA